ncbi:MAG: SMEK domain-containing protein [Candidatus Pedobacter colombiensis]|uniref:SMEK domain-containing protein n=1 Tax=Candidatus Pedobacter colombiensis TaxID=3121371 RepID=A0AAJ5W9K7_9SPHI|nr:SMEK domain-containing protein [Pedobacter sp.]WEK20511.1 MAG: SMEK domain-containing protein [Pedobacter sp.]
MNRKDEMSEIRRLFILWLTEIEVENAETYYDINKVSEHLCRLLLNLLYDYKLEDLNKIKANFPGLDIGDESVSKIAFQVTSRTDRQKITENLTSIVDKNYHTVFSSGIKFLILSNSGKVVYTAKTKLPTTILPTFDINRDIVYPDHLIKRIEDIFEEEDDLVKFSQVKALLIKELAPRFKTIGTSPEAEEIKGLNEQIKTLIEKVDRQGSGQFQVLSHFFEGDLEVPSLKQLHHRTNLLEGFLKIIRDRGMLWIQGPTSTGKTSAAVSIAHFWEGKILWIDCRGINEDQFIEHILASLGVYFNIAFDRTFKTTVSNLIDQIERGTLLVFNDVPQLNPALRTQNQLSYFIGQAILAGANIVVTSNFTPSNNFGESDGFESVPGEIPPFLPEDTESLFKLMGGPEELLAPMSKLITSSTQGHPLLIKSAIKYLKERDWKVDEDAIVSLFTGRFDLGTDREVYQKLIHQSTSVEACELLYRLKYVIGNFDNEVLSVISAVEPAIDHPAERLNELLGSWVQDSGKGKYQLSPLIKKLNDNVTADTRAKIHVALADNILAKKNISILEACVVIHYFQAAGEFNRAAVVLIKALAEISSPQMFTDWGLNMFWYTIELPKEIAPIFRVMIRASQIALTVDDIPQINYLIDDLEKIRDEEGSGEFEKLITGSLFFQRELRTKPLHALESLLDMKQSSERIDSTIENEDSIIDKDLLNGIWFVFLGLKSIEEYREWFNKITIAKYPEEIWNPETNESYMLAAVSIYRNAGSTSSDPAIRVGVLLETLELSIKSEIWLFAAYSLKYLVKVYGEIDDLGSAVEIVKKHDWFLTKSNIFKFLVYAELSRLCFLKQELDLAFQFASPILNEKLPDQYAEMLDFDMSMTQLYAKEDPKLALSFAEAGLTLAMRNEIYLLEDRIKQFGEAAIAKTLVGRYIDALNDIAAGFELVLDNFQENEDYKALVIRFGHVALYVIQILEKGNPRDFGDGEKFVVPTPGFFYRDSDKLLHGGFYFEERKLMVATIINDCYEVIMDKDNAKKWAYKTFDLSSSISGGKFTPILQKIIFYLIEDKEYKKAYNILAYVEGFYNDIKDKVSLGKASEEEMGILQRAGATRSISDDFGVYLHILFPVALEFSKAIKNGDLPKEDFQSSIDAVFDSGKYQVSDEAEFKFAKLIFERVLIERIEYSELKAMIDNNASSSIQMIYAIGCYLLSSFVDAKQAANLQLATLITLDNTFIVNMTAFYRFSMVPYFEDFWIKVFNDQKREFTGADHLLEKGIPLIQKTNVNLRIRKLFLVMSHHLAFDMNREIEDFIN